MIDTSQLSDDAMQVWMAFFLNPKSTLRFGGDHAEMEITPEARLALDELITIGAVKPVESDDQWPGREHYGSGNVSLRKELQKRPHLYPFTREESIVVFRKKEGGNKNT